MFCFLGNSLQAFPTTLEFCVQVSTSLYSESLHRLKGSPDKKKKNNVDVTSPKWQSHTYWVAKLPDRMVGALWVM